MAKRAPRIPYVEPGRDPALAAIERDIAAERGSIPELYQALLNSPPIASGWEKLLTAVRNRTLLPPALREIAILRVAVLNRAPYEFTAHLPHALAAGVSETQVEALRAHDMPPIAAGFDEDALMVIELCDAMTRDIEVPDALYARLRARFDPRGIVEMVTTVAAYNMVSRLLVALQITHR